ncbi:colanic acid/amylovoran biosynthesis protein [Idiomarina aquatica]|uniref:Colanic acid/amylovoran biosynthesis protein n=1 Tax=Idiomarina aquatica TaxID=1327752 RepID=A0A4V3CQ19_9GAMM|nr:polysaccharide pyruvyl transferase family protein [Idiomarina aquatica]TDP40250.1 colanic acid/amylovoran biosynthesis protein [Idiomarina aquatica]
MKLIEIKGVQFVNKGAELMLHAVIQQINKRWPEADIVLAPNPFSPYRKRCQVDAFQKLSLRKNRLDLNALADRLPKSIKHYLKHQWGIITEADIDLVLDASGFAYGDQWGALKAPHLAGELKRAKRRNQPYVFLPQAFGPFTRSSDRKYFSQSLPLATFIAAREKTSFDHLKGMIGESNNLHQYPDFTNLVEGAVPEHLCIADDTVLLIPNSNMINAKNTHMPEWRKRYVDVFKNAIDSIRELGLTPLFLNHEGDGDQAICEKINSLLEKPVEIIKLDHPLEVKGVIGAAKAVICSRFHGCVSALSQATPCLGTSWSHKYERLFEDYQFSEFLLSPKVSREQFKETLQAAMTADKQRSLKAKAAELKEISQSMWNHVEAAITGTE